MSPIVLSVTIVAYFAILFTISYIAGHKADNEGFFVGNHKSAWYIVAFAMIGSTISGVTFVSVPGMVQAIMKESYRCMMQKIWNFARHML